MQSELIIVIAHYFVFFQYTQDVLGAFHSFKLDDVSHRKRKERSERELPTVNPIPKLGDENLYFAKFLTNRRLLELQMSDPSFRRYFLVQLIVILQYLTVPVKFKTLVNRYYLMHWYCTSPEHSIKSILLQFHTVNVFYRETQALSEDQLDFVKKTTEKIYELLSEIPPCGEDFVKCVKHILKVIFYVNNAFTPILRLIMANLLS